MKFKNSNYSLLIKNIEKKYALKFCNSYNIKQRLKFNLD